MRISRCPSPLLAVALIAVALPAALTAQQARPITAAEKLRVDAVFSRFDRTDTPGCMVGVNERGDLRLRAAYGMADLERSVPFTPSLLSEIGSVSKQFVAAALVLLEQEGKLSLDDPVRKHLPEFPAFNPPITIRHLLQHTSGLRDQYGLLELTGRPYGEVVHSNAEIVELISRQRTLNFPVNSAYLYSNSGYTLAAVLVERISGTDINTFTRTRLFAPLGMDRSQWRTDFRTLVAQRVPAYAFGADGWTMNMPFSNLYGAGGLVSSIDELLRWTEALHAGRVGDPSTLRTMTRVATLADGSETEYGLGFMVRDWRGVREVAHSGSTAGYRAYLAHYPDYGLSVAMQCNAGNADYVELGRRLAEVFLADRLGPEPPRTVRAPSRVAYALPASALAGLTGAWRDAETGAVVTLVPEDSAVVMRYPPAREVRFAPVAEDSLMGGGRAMAIVRDAGGRPVGFRYHAGRVLHIRFDRVPDR
jgi:CubicO group peptidase (beta-lactamase class C family)